MTLLVSKLLLILLSPSISLAVKNVLFLVADDLRPDIAAFYSNGSAYHYNMTTPNLDALAAKSLVLKNAHVQQAVCGPSRTSLMTGRRPDTTHVYDIATYWRDVSGNFTTLPQLFKDNGYETGGFGKIFHPGAASGYDDPASWTLEHFHGVKNWENKKLSWRAIKDGRLRNAPLVDEQIADAAIETLQNISAAARSGETPFFLAVGFQKPHLPFVFPESMLDFYPESDIGLPDNMYAPENMPEIAWNKYNELRNFADMDSYSGNFNTTLNTTDMLELRRAYYAAVTWVDIQIGRVIRELDTLNLTDDTIVSFWGDHGWQLGEHAEWCKSTNFDLATHAPMMIHIPGVTDSGIHTEQLTEFVDLFPTLVEAAGLENVSLSQCNENNATEDILCTEGVSLIPLISEPNTALKSAAFSQFPRNNDAIMGYTLRTLLYRYTEWVEFNATTYTPNWNDPDVERELYVYSEDPDENVNVVDANPTVAAALSQRLHDGWRNAIV